MTIEKHLKIAELMINILENKFGFWKFKFGFDPLIGLIPVIGDIIPYLLSFYFIYIAYKLKMPAKKILKMLIYSLIDFLVGFVPFFGDAIDFFYHGHLKNYQMIQEHIKNG